MSTSQLFAHPTKPSGPRRFHDRVIVHTRCGWCGTEFSFGWYRFDDVACCGDCAGMTYADVWGTG